MDIEHVQNEHECSENVIRDFCGEKIEKLLGEGFQIKTTEAWVGLLSDVDILATRVQNYQDIPNCEQAMANGYTAEMDHPQIGKVKVVGVPISLSDTTLNTTTAPPEFGQHSEENLVEPGFWWEEIAAFPGKEVL